MKGRVRLIHLCVAVLGLCRSMSGGILYFLNCHSAYCMHIRTCLFPKRHTELSFTTFVNLLLCCKHVMEAVCACACVSAAQVHVLLACSRVTKDRAAVSNMCLSIFIYLACHLSLVHLELLLGLLNRASPFQVGLSPHRISLMRHGRSTNFRSTYL